MAREELNQTFTKLVREAGLDGRGARARPRPHDLRHAFAVRTLLDCHGAGEDIDTGQIVRYLTRTYRVLATLSERFLFLKTGICATISVVMS